jgi:hypothetical protein
MSPRAAARLAWSVWALSVALIAANLWMAFLRGGAETLGIFAVITLSASLPPLTVGAIVASRRSEHPIGWMLLSMGLPWAVVGFASEYARYTLVVQPGALPGGVAMAVLGHVSFGLPIGLLALLVLLFPTGRLPSPRWRPVTWLLGSVLLITWVLPSLLAPGPLEFGPGEQLPVENPLGFQPVGLVKDWFSFWPILLTLPPIAAVAQRFRNARGVERQQLKWLLYAAAAVPMLAPVAFSLNTWDTGLPSLLSFLIGGPLWGLTVAGVPIAIGIAVLRYRLYDIDVIIRRTLVYGALTAGLGIVYWGSIVVLQELLRPMTQGSDLAIVGSTLAVAALFQPLLVRIQHIVDRRFYRQRYDASQVLQIFSQRLRDEIDLESLRLELLGAVERTVQPTDASLWLPAKAERRDSR